MPEVRRSRRRIPFSQERSRRAHGFRWRAGLKWCGGLRGAATRHFARIGLAVSISTSVEMCCDAPNLCYVRVPVARNHWCGAVKTAKYSHFLPLTAL